VDRLRLPGPTAARQPSLKAQRFDGVGHQRDLARFAVAHRPGRLTSGWRRRRGLQGASDLSHALEHGLRTVGPRPPPEISTREAERRDIGRQARHDERVARWGAGDHPVEAARRARGEVQADARARGDGRAGRCREGHDEGPPPGAKALARARGRARVIAQWLPELAQQLWPTFILRYDKPAPLLASFRIRSRPVPDAGL
jgi:hypothetical protein